MKRNVISIVFAALTFCACSKEGEPVVKESVTPAVYHVSIPASMTPGTKGVTFDGDGVSISTKFEVGDKVYVYNKTKDALARHWDGEEDSYLATPIVLTSEMIQNEGQSCTLVGDLSFVKWKYDEQEWESVSPEEGDEYCLYYLLNKADYVYSWGYDNYYPRFDYSVQDGSVTSASKCDFAIVDDVVLTLSGSTLTVPDNVRFMNLQSMFRQKLTFKNSASETVTPTIQTFSINTENETLICYHNPTCAIGDSPEKYQTFSIDIDNPVISDGNIYLSLAFYYPNDASKSDKLIFTATDTERNVYRCTKNVPDGGFQNGKYYYGNCTMEWDHQIIMPTVERSDGGDLDELTPYGDYYDIYSGTSGEIAISISGSSNGFCFWLNSDPATVTLKGDGTAVFPHNNSFIYDDSADVTIILESNYTIICPNHEAAIWSEGSLKLMTSGSSPQTLTVTANSKTYKGLYGDSNYDRGDDDVSPLAVAGYTVELTSTTDGPDENSDGNPDYYTWVYTVTPNP